MAEQKPVGPDRPTRARKVDKAKPKSAFDTMWPYLMVGLVICFAVDNWAITKIILCVVWGAWIVTHIRRYGF